MKLDKIPEIILNDIRSRGWSDEEIQGFTAKQAFNEFCYWHGLLGWGDNLWDTVHKLKEAE